VNVDRGHGRTLAVFAVAGWGVYGLLWVLAARQGLPSAWGAILVMPLVLIAVFAIFAAAWIAYNRARVRRHGERRGPEPVRSVPLAFDRRGRLIHLVGDPRVADVVVIDVEGDTKTFRDALVGG